MRAEDYLSPEGAEILRRWEEEQYRKEQEAWAREEAARRARLKPPEPPRVRCTVTRDHGIETISTPRRGPRMIHGIASTPTITNKRGKHDPAKCKIRMPVPLLCAHHDQGRIGEVVLVRKSPESIYVRAVFDDTAAANFVWDLVENGEMRALSIGASSSVQAVVQDADGLDVTFFDAWLLKEVSICRRGANPDCYCEPFKWWEGR